MKRVAVFGSLDDPQVSHVISRATRRGLHVVQIAPEGWLGDGREPHSIYLLRDEKPRAELGLEDAFDVHSAWVRALPPPFPEIDTRAGPPLERKKVAAFALEARERASAVLSVIDALLAQEKAVINPPARGLGLHGALAQLVRLKHAGVRVADTLLTDDPEAAAVFAKDRNVRARSLTGAPPAAREAIVRSPVLLQAIPSGETVQAIACEATIVAPRTLPPPIMRAIEETQRALGWTFVGIEVVFDSAHPEEYAVLDADPSPAFLEQDLKSAHRISDALLDALQR